MRSTERALERLLRWGLVLLVVYGAAVSMLTYCELRGWRAPGSAVVLAHALISSR